MRTSAPGQVSGIRTRLHTRQVHVLVRLAAALPTLPHARAHFFEGRLPVAIADRNPVRSGPSAVVARGRVAHR